MAAEGDRSVKVPVHQAGVAIHKPCYFELENGATEPRCRRVSGVHKNNLMCVAMKCASLWRPCEECTRLSRGEHSSVVRPGSDFCEEHKELQVLRDAAKRREEAVRNGAAKHQSAPRFTTTRPVTPIARTSLADRVAKATAATKNVSASKDEKVVAPKPEPPKSRKERREQEFAKPRIDDDETTGARPVVETKEEGQRIIAEVKKAIDEAEYAKVDIRRIRRMEGQPRKFFDAAKLYALGESIRQVGQITDGYVRRIPLDAEGHDLELVDGERRWRSMRDAGELIYKSKIIDISGPAAQFLVSVIANFHRADHTVLEMADAVAVMMDELHLSAKEVVQATGYHKDYVSQLYGLRRLVPEVRHLIDPESSAYEPKKFNVTAAMAVSGRPPEMQKSLADRYIRKEISLAMLRREGRQLMEAQGLTVRGHDRSLRAIGDKVRVVSQQMDELEEYLNATVPEVLDRMTSEKAKECIAKLEALQVKAAMVVKRLRPMTLPKG